jgi:hypothetical protein
MKKKHFFKEGDEVCHKENLNLIMTVSRILKESKEFIKGYDENGKVIKEQGIRMLGIECHWWATSITIGKELKTFKFHSRELVPKNIAEQGKDKVIEWLHSNN